MDLDKEIKIEKQEQVSKKKIKQKQNGVYEVLLQLYQPHPYDIQVNQVAHEVQDIYELLRNSPSDRSQKTIKKIKSQLSEMKCFKIPPYQQSNAEFYQIFKRDNLNIISMIAPFVQMTKYEKGHLIQVTGTKREYVKILLMGQVSLYEPFNYKAFKNCQIKSKNKQFLIKNVVKHMKEIENVNANLVEENNLENGDQQLDIDNNILSITQAQFQKQDMPNQTIKENEEDLIFQNNLKYGCLHEDHLSANTCKNIMIYCGILTSITPHKLARTIQRGDFIADKDQLLFVDQKQNYAGTTICCTDCVFLQINYQIAKQVISLIAADRQRPFIQSLLFKFPMLKYLEAKQYVTQDYMIVQQCEDQNGTKISKKSAVQIIKQLKVVSSINFELSFTGQMYLIISGDVTLIIDQISERKPSTIQYVISQKRVLQKQILHLYKNDIFGIQEIGHNKSTNLRYLISMGSKILKINANVMKNHMHTIFGFSKCLKEMQKERNELIQQILERMQNSLQNQQIQRHEVITFSKKQNNLPRMKLAYSQHHLGSDPNHIRELKYYGHQDYEEASKKIKKHFSPENLDIPKQKLSPDIVEKDGLGLQFAKNLIRKSDEEVQIKNGWIYIRNYKGVLLRKKKIRQICDSKDSNLTKGDILLRKIGVLNSKQIADHNLQMVKKRPSKYEFADLKKQQKQFKQIRQKTRSLPKLTNFYAKKEDRLFSIIYKRTHI